MILFEIGVCVGGVGIIIVLILANENRKDRPLSKTSVIMFKIGGVMTLVGGVLAAIGIIITKLAS